MKEDQIIRTEDGSGKQNSLKTEISQLKAELYEVTNKVDAFEALLRSHLTLEIVTSQELAVLYKAQKSEKKAKRLDQKRKGKRYVAPIGLTTQKQTVEKTQSNEDDLKEKKRLYREAMLHVHPDKFSMNDDKIDLATALTTRLVEIYKHEDLATLQAYHAHLFGNIELIKDAANSVNKIALATSPDAYLMKEKAELEHQLSLVKNRHTYFVLTTYQDPTAFIDELRAYYQDRINKLRRRTRTKG
ncbi:MAG: hypothetical protein RIA69_04770 [Cyclobacteriaceae bacterium]